MPRKDGTGPMGAGSKTGKGLGPCSGDNAANKGCFGLGLRSRFARWRGSGRGFGRGQSSAANDGKSQKDLLEEQKEALKSRIDAIDQRLENL